MMLSRLLLDELSVDDNLKSDIVFLQQLIGFIMQSFQTEPIVLTIEESDIEMRL